MNPAVVGLLDFSIKAAVLLGMCWGALRLLGAPLLTQSIRTALAPELAKLASFELDLGQLRKDHETLGSGITIRRAELDRRIGTHEGALAQLPAIRVTLDHLAGEMARSNALNERAMVALQDMSLQIGRLQGAHEATRSGGP